MARKAKRARAVAIARAPVPFAPKVSSTEAALVASLREVEAAYERLTVARAGVLSALGDIGYNPAIDAIDRARVTVGVAREHAINLLKLARRISSNHA